jgi:CDP-diacylglycerol--serine O-phosphatidyltransferase
MRFRRPFSKLAAKRSSAVPPPLQRPWWRKMQSSPLPVSERKRPSKGVYLLPNLLTTAALFCGFFGIVQGMDQHFATAAMAIFAAMVLDGLDGRVARMTNTQSAFGAEYDSLADMVSFGAAPALIVYEWALHGMGKWGWVAAFVYLSAAALRLARFNTTASSASKAWFQGLPSPAAAALVTSFVWVSFDADLQGPVYAWAAWCITFVAGVSMISSLPFFSGKEFQMSKGVPFVVLALLPLLFVLISQDPPKALFALFSVYALSGYIVFLVRKVRGQGLNGLDIEEDKHF